MSFSADGLYELLRRHLRRTDFRVGFSGGLDSHVLLHAMASLRGRYPLSLSAVHINHAASPHAEHWVGHCREVCEDLQVDLEVHVIDGSAPVGESQEAWFRRQRYHLFAECLAADQVLLTAHHADDQAETLLLQLLRGSGPAGLASMPLSRPLGRGRHVRPLLGFSRAELAGYAAVNELAWVEDESNQDRGYDRNYLRHAVMPLLLQRWPGALQTLGRAASIQAETSGLLYELAATDLEALQDPVSGALALTPLRRLSAARQRNVLRYWLTGSGLTAPDSRQLEAIIGQVMDARVDAEPCLTWRDTEVRRYRDRLFAMRRLPKPQPDCVLPWNPAEAVQLPLGQLLAREVSGNGLKEMDMQRLEVRYRHGGEAILLPGRQRHASLKNLFQEAGIPPWLRRFMPLIYRNGKLISVAGLWYERDAAAGREENGWSLEWTIPERPDLDRQLAACSGN